MNNIELVFPEIFISLSIMFLLILGVFKKDSSKIIHNFSLLILVITAVINKTTRDIFWIILELSFLKTPKISKNIIDNEIKISGNINSMLFIVCLPR